MKKRQLSKLLAVLLALAMFAVACGSDDEPADTAEESDAVEVVEEDEAPAEEAEEEAPAEEAEEEAPAEEEEEAAVENEDAIEAGTEAEGDVDTEVEEVDAAERQRGGSIVVGLEAEAVGLRPWEDTCASPCYNMMITIYDKLMELTTQGSYSPWLLASIEPNEDFTEWTGVLREGVTFHNGVALTAQTVADMFPIQQEGSTAAGQIAASNLADVQATGDLEVTWSLSRSNSAFPAFLSRAPLGMVFDPAAAAADPDGYSENPIGTGPFRIVSRDLDNETVVERNDDYWFIDENGTQLPYLDSISFRPIPDEGTRLDAVLSGTANVAQTLRQGTIRDARLAKEDGADIELFEFQGNNVGGGMFNVLIPPYDDVRVRRGLTHLNPQDQVIEALGGTGISLPGTQYFSPDSPWYSEKVAQAWPQFDFEAGVALLEEYINDPERSDGQPVGTNINPELSCPPDPTLIAAMQVIEQVWSSTGLVDVNITNYDQQTHINYALGADSGFVGSHTTHCWRVGSDDDPSLVLNPAYSPPTAEIATAAGLEGVVSPLNFHNYFSGELFGNLIAATQTADFDERYALYEAVMLEIADQVPVWYSGHTATALVVDSNIKGLNSWETQDGILGFGHPAAEGRWHSVYIEG